MTLAIIAYWLLAIVVTVVGCLVWWRQDRRRARRDYVTRRRGFTSTVSRGAYVAKSLPELQRRRDAERGTR
jgi:cytochrome c-type biogenesis protein CcmH/NrfF